MEMEDGLGVPGTLRVDLGTHPHRCLTGGKGPETNPGAWVCDIVVVCVLSAWQPERFRTRACIVQLLCEDFRL